MTRVKILIPTQDASVPHGTSLSKHELRILHSAVWARISCCSIEARPCLLDRANAQHVPRPFTQRMLRTDKAVGLLLCLSPAVTGPFSIFPSSSTGPQLQSPTCARQWRRSCCHCLRSAPLQLRLYLPDEPRNRNPFASLAPDRRASLQQDDLSRRVSRPWCSTTRKKLAASARLGTTTSKCCTAGR
jgi:hypothetical protein